MAGMRSHLTTAANDFIGQPSPSLKVRRSLLSVLLLYLCASPGVNALSFLSVRPKYGGPSMNRPVPNKRPVGYSKQNLDAHSKSIPHQLHLSSNGDDGQKDAAQAAEGLHIVGAGLAGLATALAVKNIAGVKSFHLIERFTKDELHNTAAGAGVLLGPNGLRALRAIQGEEIVNQIYSEGTCLKGNVILLPDQNMQIPATAAAECGLPEVMIPWGILRRILIDLLPSDCIITTCAADDIVGYSICQHDGTDAVQLVYSSLETANNIAIAPAPLLIAADGIYSTFQALVNSGDCILPPGKEDDTRKQNINDNGRLNIKAVVPTDLGPNFEPDMTYSVFSPDGIACFAGPAGKGFSYWAISIPDQTSDDEQTKRFLSDDDISDKVNMKAKLITKLKDLNNEKCQFAIDLIEQTDSSRLFAARSEEREHVGPSLISKDGLVVLTGDAAHSMSPSYGQAANFAFEDAAVLATCLRDGDNLKSAMIQYSRSRIARCIEMQRRSVERQKGGMKTEDISKWIWEFEV